MTPWLWGRHMHGNFFEILYCVVFFSFAVFYTFLIILADTKQDIQERMGESYEAEDGAITMRVFLKIGGFLFAIGVFYLLYEHFFQKIVCDIGFSHFVGKTLFVYLPIYCSSVKLFQHMTILDKLVLCCWPIGLELSYLLRIVQ